MIVTAGKRLLTGVSPRTFSQTQQNQRVNLSRFARKMHQTLGPVLIKEHLAYLYSLSKGRVLPVDLFCEVCVQTHYRYP